MCSIKQCLKNIFSDLCVNGLRAILILDTATMSSLIYMMCFLRQDIYRVFTFYLGGKHLVVHDGKGKPQRNILWLSMIIQKSGIFVRDKKHNFFLEKYKDMCLTECKYYCIFA